MVPPYLSIIQCITGTLSLVLAFFVLSLIQNPAISQYEVIIQDKEIIICRGFLWSIVPMSTMNWSILYHDPVNITKICFNNLESELIHSLFRESSHNLEKRKNIMKYLNVYRIVYLALLSFVIFHLILLTFGLAFISTLWNFWFLSLLAYCSIYGVDSINQG